MPRFILSWSGGGPGGHIRDPTWADVEGKLDGLGGGLAGSVQLDVVEGPEDGPRGIRVLSDGSVFYIMVGHIGDDGEYDVRTFRGGEVIPGCVAILGDLYPADQARSDKRLVGSCFRDFHHKLDVSGDVVG